MSTKTREKKRKAKKGGLIFLFYLLTRQIYVTFDGLLKVKEKKRNNKRESVYRMRRNKL